MATGPDKRTVGRAAIVLCVLASATASAPEAAAQTARTQTPPAQVAQPIQASVARPQSEPSTTPAPVSWPMQIPVLGTRVHDPGEGRAWLVSTRIDETSLTVTAAAPGGVLAVSLRRARQGHPTCQALVTQVLHREDLDAFRAPTPAVFHGAPWESDVFQQSNASHDAEFGCVRSGDDVWLVTAIAQPRAGVNLGDASAMARQMSSALAMVHVRRGYPLRLDVSTLEVEDPSDGAAWLFTGRAQGFPLPSDAVSSSAGAPGGVTLTVGRFHGTCVAAWDAARPAFANAGTLVDRPGYVPVQFGARIRRLTVGERMREIYCLSTPRGALVVTSVFRGDDGDAMTRMAPFLRVLVSAAGREALSPAPAAARPDRLITQ